MKDSIYKLRNIKYLLVILLLIAWLVTSATFFILQMNNEEVQDFESTLTSVAHNNANAVEILFQKYINFLKITGDFSKNSGYKHVDFEAALNNLVLLEDFSQVAVVLPNGGSYITNGEKISIADYHFTPEMQSKETYITNVYYDKYAQTDVVAINIPLLDEENNLIAYIVGIVTTENLSESFNAIFYDLGGYYHVIDSHGKYVAASNAKNMIAMDVLFHEAFSVIDLVDGYKIEDLLGSFKNRTEGLTRYVAGDQERVAYYSPIDINNWIMYSVVPQELIAEEINNDLKTTVLAVLNISAIFIILIFWVYRSQRGLKRYAEISEKNFRFVSEQTNKFILEWDFASDQVKVTGKLKEIFNREQSVLSISNEVFHQFIHPDDLQTAREHLEQLKHGKKISDVKVRVEHNDGHFVWCIFSAVPISSGIKGKIYDKALGFMEDIDAQEREAALLKMKSELDSLTHIYNKGTTEYLIDKIITSSKVDVHQHTLIIIDLDNFKQLNDTFGHQFGDEVIKELATFLKNLFRSNDIVGRIGGDEFFVFMRDTTIEKRLEEKCNQILKQFHKFYEKNGKSVEISASIGVALYPEHGTIYKELYHNADVALYSAKKHGKNNYQLFNGNTDINYVSQRTDIESSKNNH